MFHSSELTKPKHGMDKFILVAIVALLITGCATAPALQGARPAASIDHQYGLAKSDLVEKTDHMTKHLNVDSSVVYFQNQGGGGAGLGILLGPFGVAANMRMIDSITTSDVDKLKGKILLNPVQAFQQAAATNGFPVQLSATTNDIKVTPYILVSKTDQLKISISSIVLFEGTTGQSKWVRRYQYQLPENYTLDELSTFDEGKMLEIQAASVNAFSSLLMHIKGESDVAILNEPKITFKSPYLSPRFDFEMMGSLIAESDGRVWVRTTFGVAAIDPSYIQYHTSK